MSRRVASITVLATASDPLLTRIAERCPSAFRASSLGDLRGLLGQLIHRAPPRPATLDLVGHSTKDHQLLRMGSDVVDMFDPEVYGLFRSLAADRVLSRASVVGLRLLGCETATRPAGQRTMRLLAHVLKLPVFGTRKLLCKSHYNAHGFDSEFGHILVETSQLPSRPWLTVPIGEPENAVDDSACR